MNTHSHSHSNSQVIAAFILILVIFGGLFFVGMTSLKANITAMHAEVSRGM